MGVFTVSGSCQLARNVLCFLRFKHMNWHGCTPEMDRQAKHYMMEAYQKDWSPEAIKKKSEQGSAGAGAGTSVASAPVPAPAPVFSSSEAKAQV